MTGEGQQALRKQGLLFFARPGFQSSDWSDAPPLTAHFQAPVASADRDAESPRLGARPSPY